MRTVVPVTDQGPSYATLTTALSGSNNDLVYTAAVAGPIGNAVRIRYVVAGNNTPLSIDVEGFDLTVNVATDGGGAATTTADALKAAIAADADALGLVFEPVDAPANDGSGILAAMGYTNLAAGGLMTFEDAEVNADTTNGHYFTANDGLTWLEVRNSGGTPRDVTFKFGRNANAHGSVASFTETIPANATRKIGPFSSGSFDQSLSRDVYFDPAHADLRFRAFRAVKA